MSVSTAADRVAALRRLLQREGLAGAVSAAGRDGEIAAVRARPELRARLAELAEEIRTLGFRYVALEPRARTDEDENP